jgi:predicted exporter
MFEALHDSFGVPYKEKIIIPMDDDDKARMQAESQQAASQNKLGQISAQGEVKKDVLPDEPVSPVVEVPEIIESPHPQDTSSDVKE